MYNEPEAGTFFVGGLIDGKPVPMRLGASSYLYYDDIFWPRRNRAKHLRDCSAVIPSNYKIYRINEDGKIVCVE